MAEDVVSDDEFDCCAEDVVSEDEFDCVAANVVSVDEFDWVAADVVLDAVFELPVVAAPFVVDPATVDTVCWVVVAWAAVVLFRLCSPMVAQPPILAPTAARVSPIFMPVVFTTGRFCGFDGVIVPFSLSSGSSSSCPIDRDKDTGVMFRTG